MIIIKSDYSPSVAPEKQEEDNQRMLQMLLVLAEIPGKPLDQYINLTRNSAIEYDRALGSNPGPEEWDAAKAVTRPYQEKAEELLIRHGVTIQNLLARSTNPGFFSHIETTVYNGYGKMQPVARIERPITDIEAETYEDNCTGYGAHHALCR